MKLTILHLFLILLISLLTTGCSNEEQTNAITPIELHEVGKLELVEYRSEEIFVISDKHQSITDISSLEDAAEYLNSLLQVGDRIGVYSFDFYTIAYIDLHQLEDRDILWDATNKSIQVTLPPVEIEPIGRGGEIRLLHERVNGNKKSITSNERQNMQRQAIGLAKKNLLPGTPKYQEIVTKAQNKARAYLTGMMKARGCQEVTIRFKER